MTKAEKLLVLAQDGPWEYRPLHRRDWRAIDPAITFTVLLRDEYEIRVKPPEFKRGEVIEVTDSDEWPEYPVVARFHSYVEGDEFPYETMCGNGDVGWWYKHARKLEV